MATKAERFKSKTERSGPKQAPKSAKKPKAEAGDAKPKTPRAPKPKTANSSKAAAKKAEVVLEESATGTPSRKSTRKAANKGKLASALERRETRKARSPQARALKATTKRAVAKKPSAKKPIAKPAPAKRTAAKRK